MAVQMGERCEIFLDKAVYAPGDTINGRIDCHFFHENKVTAIKVKLKGIAKVRWSKGKNSHYSAEQSYFDHESDLLTQETTFPPGVYGYPFTFPLATQLPSSMTAVNGSITFVAKAQIDRPWAIDYESKKTFEVHSYNDLNSMYEVQRPYEFRQMFVPKLLYISEASGPITINVSLPATGYVPLQMISFLTNLRNDSGVTVQEVHFHLAQAFTFHAQDNSIKTYILRGQEYAITDSRVVSGSEKSWDLQLRVPSDIFNRSLPYCNVIKVSWELKGEIFLPLAYKNFKINIPLILGNVPILGTSL